MKVLSSNLFDSTCEYLTNTINTSGAMGAGLALEFRLRVPELYPVYKEKCDRGEIKVGAYWIFDRPNRIGRKILNFPTKRGFNHPSKLEYIWSGLEYFRDNYSSDRIASIAFPILGARQGKLDRETVLEVMKEYLAELPIDVEIHYNTAPDKFTVWLKKRINEMTLSEISDELKISKIAGDHLKAQLSTVTYLSDLVAFKNISIRVIQALYDFGFRTIYDSKLHPYVEPQAVHD